jgi:DNA-binding LacI/PurR family transcriptional regulator
MRTLEIDPADPPAAHTAVSEFLDRHPEVTAVAAADDALAVLACSAASQIGRAVPDELSVVGYGNSPAARWSQPPLTSVRPQLRQMGREAALLLLGRCSGETRSEPPRRVDIEPQLEVRKSAGRAKKK